MSQFHIKSIEVEQFRQFQKVEKVHGLSPELNVIAGNNEAGKSTLLQAVRAALFERHSSTVGEKYRPYGSQVSPKICLEFHLDGVEYTLTKVFSRLSDGKATLNSSDGRSWEGRAAEDHLADLLDYSYPRGGASKWHHQGVAGLLWVEQAKASEQVVLTDQSRQQLHSVFEEGLREILGGDQGEILHRRITELKEQYFTKQDKPRVDYQRLIDQESDLKHRLQSAKTELEEYEEKVDRLEQKESELRTYQRERTLEKAEDQAESAQKADRLVTELRRKVEAGTDRLGRGEAELNAAKQASNQRRKLMGDLESARESQKSLEQTVGGKNSELKARNKHLAELESSRDELKDRKHVKDTALHIARDTQKLLELVEEHDGLNSRHERATNADSKRRNCISERDSIRVTDEKAKELKEIEREKDLAEARLQAAATRIEHRLQVGAKVRLGDRSLVGEGSFLLTQQTELEIEKVGQFTVIPGGEGLDVLRSKVKAETRRLARVLSEAEAESIEHAEANLKRKNQLDNEANELSALMEGLAPEGLQALEDRVVSIGAQKDSLQRKLGDNPEQEFDIRALEEEVKSLQDQIDKIDQDVDSEAKLISESREELAGLRVEMASAERTANRHSSELEQARNAKTDDDLLTAVTEAERMVEVSGNQLEEARQALDAQNPEAVSAEVERSNQALVDVRNEIGTLERTSRDLKVALSALGHKGLAEEVATLDSEHAAVNLQLETMNRHAKAVDLLHRVLDEAMLRAKDSVAKPVAAKLDPYLRQLIPDALPAIDENLTLTGIERGGSTEPFSGLSVGTREQLAVLVRLAYADLLSDAGIPAIVILDDALVNSDDGRRDRMKAILYQASKRYQILLLTCHGREYRNTGGNFIRLEQKSMGSGNQ